MLEGPTLGLLRNLEEITQTQHCQDEEFCSVKHLFNEHLLCAPNPVKVWVSVGSQCELKQKGPAASKMCVHHTQNHPMSVLQPRPKSSWLASLRAGEGETVTQRPSKGHTLLGTDYLWEQRYPFSGKVGFPRLEALLINISPHNYSVMDLCIG